MLKIFLLTVFIYQFYFGAGRDFPIQTQVEVTQDQVIIINNLVTKTYEIKKYIGEETLPTGKTKSYTVYNSSNCKNYRLEINEQFCFIVGDNSQEVFSNFEIKKVNN